MKPRFSIKKTAFAIFTVSILMGVTVTIALADGNDFLDGELRADLPEIYNAGDYQVLLYSGATPIYGTNFTDAWLGVDLAQGNGNLYSALFTQVGLLTQSDGIHWFFYSEAGAVCLSGHTAWGSFGCEGNANDLVSLGNWYKMELVRLSGGWWLARIYDTYGNPHDIAETWVNNSTRIYAAFSTEEEAYLGNPDPFLTAAFYIWHPQYLTTSGWQEWPLSTSGTDSIIIAKDNNGQNSFVRRTTAQIRILQEMNGHGMQVRAGHNVGGFFSHRLMHICHWC